MKVYGGSLGPVLSSLEYEIHEVAKSTRTKKLKSILEKIEDGLTPEQKDDPDFASNATDELEFDIDLTPAEVEYIKQVTGIDVTTEQHLPLTLTVDQWDRAAKATGDTITEYIVNKWHRENQPDEPVKLWHTASQNEAILAALKEEEIT